MTSSGTFFALPCPRCRGELRITDRVRLGSETIRIAVCERDARHVFHIDGKGVMTPEEV